MASLIDTTSYYPMTLPFDLARQHEREDQGVMAIKPEPMDVDLPPVPLPTAAPAQPIEIAKKVVPVHGFASSSAAAKLFYNSDGVCAILYDCYNLI